MPSFPQLLAERLNDARSAGLFRELSVPFGADFSSNDYLGFALDTGLGNRLLEACRGIPPGSTASRLLRGHTEIHAEVERELARFSRQEAALLYPSGYQANVGIYSSLLRPGDRVYSDSANHASIIDGIRLSGSEKRIFRHNDLNHLETLLKEDCAKGGLKLIATESLFSMSGDFAPLREMTDLADHHGAQLIVDEAHATGLWGSGLVERQGLSSRVLATLHTGGKALGSAGAWIAGSQAIKSYLVNFSRSQIFSTSISPWIAQALRVAVLHHGEIGATRARELGRKIALFRECLGLDPGEKEPLSPIIPWRIPNPEEVVNAARRLREQGFDVRAIRPPTVPLSECCLRITLKWQNTESEIRDLATALTELSPKIFPKLSQEENAK